MGVWGGVFRSLGEQLRAVLSEGTWSAAGALGGPFALVSVDASSHKPEQQPPTAEAEDRALHFSIQEQCSMLSPISRPSPVPLQAARCSAGFVITQLSLLNK